MEPRSPDPDILPRAQGPGSPLLTPAGDAVHPELERLIQNGARGIADPVSLNSREASNGAAKPCRTHDQRAVGTDSAARGAEFVRFASRRPGSTTRRPKPVAE